MKHISFFIKKTKKRLQKMKLHKKNSSSYKEIDVNVTICYIPDI